MRRRHLLPNLVRLVGVIAAGVLCRLAATHRMADGFVTQGLVVVMAGFLLSDSFTPEEHAYRRGFTALAQAGIGVDASFALGLIHPEYVEDCDTRMRLKALRDYWALTLWRRVYVIAHVALYLGFLSLLLSLAGWSAPILRWAFLEWGLGTSLVGWLGLGIHRRYLPMSVMALGYALVEESRDVG